MRLVLIVDDSKTARLLLRKMLAKYDVDVAMAESGEEALEYLQGNKPDVIFMDHMMPGMDGFAAVKAIKADPDIASIPIVMHTTKQGDIYLGQARALGAVDILTKPASASDLSRILEQVNNRDTRIETEIEPVVVPDTVVVTPPFYGSARQSLFVLIWVVSIVWLISLYVDEQVEIKLLQQQQAKTFGVIEALMNRQQTYDYGEVPMGGNRLALLETILPLLEQAGFRGAIRIEGHVGDFCLSQISLADGSEVMMLPSPELPLTACDVIGVSGAMAMRQSIAQSPGFAALRKQSQRAGAAIRIELAAYGATTPQYSYPVDIESVSTGDWNAVALDNNRVKYLLIAD